MKILGLCVFKNHWSTEHQVDLIDLRHGRDVLSLPNDYGKDYDLVLASPPCEQFTKANQHNWEVFPRYYVEVAEKCLWICEQSKKPWLLENVPGRIEKFIPALTKYRVATWQSRISGKQYNVYSNMLMLFPIQKKGNETINNYTKNKRQLWQPDFIDDINSVFKL